jgi:N-acetyl-anhydromuramyl-L-alanine amidase AmpD
VRNVQATNYTPGRARPIRLIVIHTTEALEVHGSALGTAKYFAGQPKSDRGSSAHFCIDATEVVQCVAVADTAWAAPGANADGIHLEHAGKAGQTAAQWADPYSDAVLARSAALASTLARAYGIPVRHLTDAELAAGGRGFVGHDQVSRVYKRSDHTDPGEHWPWDRYMHLVAAGGGPTPEDPMTAADLTPEALNGISKEVWGSGSDQLVVIDAKLKQYADRVLPNGRPVIAPITALRWAMEGTIAIRDELSAVRASVDGLRSEVAALAASSGADPQALSAVVSAAVRAELLKLRFTQ